MDQATKAIEMLRPYVRGLDLLAEVPPTEREREVFLMAAPGVAVAFANLVGVPSTERLVFLMATSANLEVLREFSKRKNLAQQVRNAPAIGAADALIVALEGLSPEEKVYTDEMLAIMSDGRPIKVDQLIDTLGSVWTILGGSLKTPGAKRGSRGVGVANQEFRSFVLRLLRDVRMARGGRIGHKRLAKAIEMLRPYAAQAIPRHIPETTLKRIIRDNEGAK